MVEPARLPETTPVPETTDAADGVPLVQVPPPVASLKVIVALAHNDVAPDIGAGNGFTVSV